MSDVSVYMVCMTTLFAITIISAAYIGGKFFDMLKEAVKNGRI